MTCRICGNGQGNTSWQAREMMLGLRTPFTYFECAACGCLQIADMPQDLAPYYPPNYYSFETSPPPAASGLGARLKLWRDSAELSGRPWIGRMLAWRRPNHELASLRTLDLTRDSRILDIGAGSGRILGMMAALGFRSLEGIDAHLPEERFVGEGYTVKRISIFDFAGEFDLLLFNHSFEHMEEPGRVLGEVRRLLAPGGACCLRIPTASSHAWRHYRTDWVQLDAPRHFYLHSTASIGRVARDAGFRIERLFRDSSAFQIWGSEQYRRDIPLLSERSWLRNPGASEFRPGDLRRFAAQARALDRRGEGDEMVVILQPDRLSTKDRSAA
jgi:SAM-dependent methyltransferase